jgi:hypothetical protein
MSPQHPGGLDSLATLLESARTDYALQAIHIGVFYRFASNSDVLDSISQNEDWGRLAAVLKKFPGLSDLRIVGYLWYPSSDCRAGPGMGITGDLREKVKEQICLRIADENRNVLRVFAGGYASSSVLW